PSGKVGRQRTRIALFSLAYRLSENPLTSRSHLTAPYVARRLPFLPFFSTGAGSKPSRNAGLSPLPPGEPPGGSCFFRSSLRTRESKFSAHCCAEYRRSRASEAS